MVYFLILFVLNTLAITYFIFRKDEEGNRFTLRDAFNFTTNNSEKVFTVIIIIMLIVLSFLKVVLQIFSEHYSIETEDWKPLNLLGVELLLPASMYLTVVALLLAMLLIHSNKIIHYYIVIKFGQRIKMDSEDKEDKDDKQIKINSGIEEHYSSDMSGKVK
jgi:cell division protein FtsL